MTRKTTTKEFITNARRIHKSRYSYDRTIYKNRCTKVIITCSVHGDFNQAPNNHIRGNGCPDCVTNKKLTTEQFTEKASKVHKGRYSYDKTIYTNAHTKVIITCGKHGDFHQAPNNHLQGQGCSDCKHDRLRMTTEEFKLNARKIHHEKYSYEKIIYKNVMTDIVITCDVHGDFNQRPITHLRGSGCPTCAGTKRLTTEEFKSKARQIHGEKYSYEKSEYASANDVVTITCTVESHGDFQQTAASHLQGHGCSKCAGGVRSTNAEFIFKARQIHGDRYSYENTVYTNAAQKVAITCSVEEHGDFQLEPSLHLQGRGCPECAKLLATELRRKAFLREAIKIHKGKYQYDDVQYLDCTHAIKIICPAHGPFWQIPRNHLRGAQCPDCNFERHPAYKRKRYEFPSGQVEFVQGYEGHCLDEFLLVYPEEDIVLHTVDMPRIFYTHGGKQHRYYPDVFLPKERKFIEVKSEYTFWVDMLKNFRKLKACWQAGYDAEIRIYCPKTGCCLGVVSDHQQVYFGTDDRAKDAVEEWRRMARELATPADSPTVGTTPPSSGRTPPGDVLLLRGTGPDVPGSPRTADAPP